MRRLVLVLLVGCARGTSEPAPAADAKDTDGPGQQPDGMNPEGMMSGTCTMTFTGTLARWDFAGETGSQAQTVVTTKATGITAGPITRATGLTPTAGANSINTSSWPLSATLDPAKYYTLTIAPPAGCMLALTSATIDALASGTGPASGAVATSVDAYAMTKPVSTTTAGAVAITAMSSTMIELRVYGWAATAGGGTLRLKTALVLDGELR